MSRLPIGRVTATSLPRLAKREARSAWKPFLDDNDPPPDIDSILRVADMAAHYRADKPKIRSFLKRAADRKSQLAQHAGLSAQATRSGDRALYVSMRVRCDASRLLAEADALLRISWLFRPKGEIEGEIPLL